MALLISGTNIEIASTGVKVPTAYARIVCINKEDGTSVAKISVYASKQHYKNIQKKEPFTMQSQIKIPISFGFKLSEPSLFDLVAAHNAYIQQFQANGFTAEINDLD
jgi:hypothetical protein